ncbi:Intracellular protein transport protein USO1 [Fusarium austroafricanum]|uniref:Intracellular protein transport protein USO1 n=1 Tax=Fusarium austroafricanum TaxID=2364996 RepID=A0A8H4KA24_9HYPO|nr:Intracellular protein transport protein USO1 [Fusarium austroafricanum]
MNQNQIESVEQQLYQDRGIYFRGTARIRFAHLRFGNLCPREPNKKITAQLKERFSSEGCLRLEPKNHIPAVISQDTLDACIRASPNVSQDVLLENNGKQPPELRLPENCMVECLQGLHRVAAGKEFLPRRDWWWTIDLYLEAGLDALRIIPGLFVGFRIEHRFMAMKCHEEASNYLLHILQVWKSILGGKESLMPRVDRQTIELLQLRAPGYSSHDASVVSKNFREGTIFSAIRHQGTRKSIWRNLQSLPCLIPSLYSFFEDLKYLQPPAKVVRQLVAPSKNSTREAMWRIFTAHGMPENQWLLQTGDGEADYQWLQGSSSDQFEFGYQQIWLYAWRYWAELVPECPRKEEGEATPISQRPDPRRWREIARLAARLGFESDEIDGFLSLDPDREIAKEALLKARSPEQFGYDDSAFESYVTEVCRIFNLAKEIPAADSKPCLLIPGCGESLARRCGRVYDNAYKADRKYLFLSHLYDLQHGESSGLSSFAVRMSVYFAFFGRRLPAGNTDKESIGGRLSQSTTQGQQETTSTSITAPGTSEIQVMPPASEATPNVPTSEDLQTLPTAVSDTDMIDYIPTDPSEMIIKVWKDGLMHDYRDPVSISQGIVEKMIPEWRLYVETSELYH